MAHRIDLWEHNHRVGIHCTLYIQNSTRKKRKNQILATFFRTGVVHLGYRNLGVTFTWRNATVS